MALNRIQKNMIDQDFVKQVDDQAAQLAQSAKGSKPSYSVWEEFEQRVVNVKWFGAKGDGVTDDWQAITNAIQVAREIYGAIVFFPRGNYAVGQTIKHLNSVKIKGIRGATTISALDTVIGSLIDASEHSSKIEISDIGLLGKSDIDAVYFNNANGSFITNVIFTTFKNGVHSFGDKSVFTDGSWGVIVRDCYFHDMHEYGVNLKYGSNMCVVTENQFWKSANGILVRNGYSDNIKNNIIQEMTGVGVTIESTHMATIETNYFERNGKDVVITKAPEEPGTGYSYRIDVLGNLFVSGTSGIITTIGVDLEYCRQVTIKRNWSREHATAFVNVASTAQQAKIEDNYSFYEEALIDSGRGTIYKQLFDDREIYKGKIEFEEQIQLAKDKATFILGNKHLATKGSLAIDDSTGLLHVHDGSTYRKAGFPAGTKAVTSGTSVRVEGTGSPDRFPVQPDQYYGVKLTPDKNVVCWYSDRTTTGFTINIAPNGDAPLTLPVGVTWEITRQ